MLINWPSTGAFVLYMYNQAPEALLLTYSIHSSVSHAHIVVLHSIKAVSNIWSALRKCQSTSKIARPRCSTLCGTIKVPYKSVCFNLVYV